MCKLHRILSLMICLILVCSVSTPVFAATDKLILIANVQDLLDFAQA